MTLQEFLIENIICLIDTNYQINIPIQNNLYVVSEAGNTNTNHKFDYTFNILNSKTIIISDLTDSLRIDSDVYKFKITNSYIENKIFKILQNYYYLLKRTEKLNLFLTNESN